MKSFTSIIQANLPCVAAYRVTPNLLNPIENLPPDSPSPAVQLAIKIRDTYDTLKKMDAVITYEPALQDLFQWGHAHRRSFSDQDWGQIHAGMLNPFQTHLANFIRNSAALSPSHWYRFEENPENEYPENPTVQMRVGEIRTPLGNIAIQKPTNGSFLFPGLGFTFDGSQISLIPLGDTILEIGGIFVGLGAEVRITNGEKVSFSFDGKRLEAEIDVRNVWYELPYTIRYPVKVWPHDDHDFALSRQTLHPKQKGKYVVVRNLDQEYTARFGAEHHFQMVGPEDILIAGGWLGMRMPCFSNDIRPIAIDLQTTRFGHLMLDSFATSRLVTASEFLAQLGYQTYISGDSYGSI